jgi:hypothetical protein
MNPIPKNPAARAGAALGFLAMAVLGWKIAGQPQAVPAAQVEQPGNAAKTKERPDRSSRRGGAPEAVRQRMAGLRAIGSTGDRMRATIELANTLPASEIGAWLDGRWFDTGRGFDVTLFNKILKERWEREDPEGLVLWSLKNNSSQASSTLAKWAETDPQRVFSFFKEHPNRDLELQTLSVIAKKNPAMALQALKDMKPVGNSRSGMSSYYLTQLVQQLAETSPAALESAIDSLPASMQTTAESALIGQKLKTSFTAEIEKLWARPDGWKIFEAALNNSNGMGEQIFAHLANMPAAWRASIASNSYSMIGDSDPEKWAKADLEGMGFTAEQASGIHAMALTKFGYKNPEAALKLMAGMELSDNNRQNMLGNVFRNFRGGAEKAEALLALLGSEEDKQAARSAMAQNSNASVSKVETPDDWLEKIGTTDPFSGGTYLYLSMLRQWDQQKITDLGSKFQSMPDEQKQQVALILTRNSSSEDKLKPLQADALRYLIANPVEPKEGQQNQQSRTTDQASEFAVNWAKSDPAAAGDWVRSLPAGEARQWAQKNLAANWAQYDPEATEQWINSLPAEDRPPVKEFIKKSAKGQD